MWDLVEGIWEIHMMIKYVCLCPRFIAPPRLLIISYTNCTNWVSQELRLRNPWMLTLSKFMPRSHIHGSPRRFYYGLNLTDDIGNANYRSPIRMHFKRMIKYDYVDYGCNTESYGSLRIATNVHPWLIRRPVRECVTWA